MHDYKVEFYDWLSFWVQCSVGPVENQIRIDIPGKMECINDRESFGTVTSQIFRDR